MQLQSPKPLPQEPKIELLLPLQQNNKIKIKKIQPHPPSLLHPHPVLQFVAAKSLIFEPPKDFLQCYSMHYCLTAFHKNKKIFSHFVNLAFCELPPQTSYIFLIIL